MEEISVLFLFISFALVAIPIFYAFVRKNFRLIYCYSEINVYIYKLGKYGNFKTDRSRNVLLCDFVTAHKNNK